VVLDLSLPRRDGTEVLEELWARNAGVSVIVLTGRGEMEHRIRCLNLGADDFLLKPFSFHELTARCRAVLRRRQQTVDATLHFGGVEMDRIARTVRREGHDVELTTKEFALLEFLLLRRGQCCSRSELLRDVWQMSPDAGTNVVDVYINYLRRKLAAAQPEGSNRQPVIETVRGEGYRLADGRKDLAVVGLPDLAFAPMLLARGA
jgi:DNA-binding response OmpR family regulator